GDLPGNVRRGGPRAGHPGVFRPEQREGTDRNRENRKEPRPAGGSAPEALRDEQQGSPGLPAAVPEGRLKGGNPMRRALIGSIVASFALVGSAAAHQSSMNVSIHSERDVTGCSDLRITFDSRPAEVSEDMFTLPGGEPLKVSLPVNAGIHVIGGDGRDFSVTACKAAR